MKKIYLTAILALIVSTVLFSQNEKETSRNTAGKNSQQELPDTKTGNIMKEWFSAINSNEPEKIDSFVMKYFSENAFKYQQSAEDYKKYFHKLHDQSSGLDIVEVLPQAPEMPLSIIAKSRKGEHYVLVRAGTDRTENNKLAGLGVERTEAPGAIRLSSINEKLSEKEIISAIDDYLNRRAGNGEFSGVVLIAKGEKTIYNNAFGYADRENRVPNRLNTQFHIASAGKMFTAAAIAQLVDEGKLRFQDTVAKVLPDYPNKEIAAKITIHQLLTHTSGMGTFFESPGFSQDKQFANAKEEIQVYKDEKLFFEPGTRWRYSNAGYSLLAAIIEQASGTNYLDYLREHIFKPAGMKNTYLKPGEYGKESRAVFYTQPPQDPMGLEPYIPDRTLMNSQGNGFGGGFTTAEDMLKFLSAFRNSKLFSNENLEKIINTKESQGTGSQRFQKYGLMEVIENGERVIGHAGGSRADMEMLWNSGYVVIVLQNAIPPNVSAVSGEVIGLLTRQYEINQNK